MYLAHLIDQALALDSIERWGPMDDLDAQRIESQLAQHGIYWSPHR